MTIVFTVCSFLVGLLAQAPLAERLQDDLAHCRVPLEGLALQGAMHVDGDIHGKHACGIAHRPLRKTQSDFG
ncbi:hypothetical protein [Marinovum algicola]|uniref:hypothetical protein n=1 Tax=Marinovum algicola TaxID=42444 RepID=UPI001113988D|nr:hypothetical protein [Marinovum algicola]